MPPQIRPLALCLMLSACQPAPAPQFALPPVAAPGEPGGPAVAASVAPAQPGGQTTETPPAPAPAPAVPTGGGSSGGAGAGAALQRFTGRVLDAKERPIPGATVMLGDGRSGTTDADGAYDVEGASGPVSASAPGFATSIVIADEPFDAFHLARNDGLSDPFDQDTIEITGTLRWPSADHQGGVAYYVDEANTWAEPHRIASDDTFGLDLTRQAARPARGVVMVLAQNSQNQRLIGVSAPFSPFEGGTPGQIQMAVADQAHAFTITDAPAALPNLASRAEIVVPDGPVVVLQGPNAASGTIDLPDAAALPGAMRLVVEASGPQGVRFSRVALPIAPGALSGAFLPLSAPQADAAAGRVSWAALGPAVRYRVEGQRPESPGRAAWEAWIGTGTSLTVGAAAWPGANGRVIVEAIDAAIATRQVASDGPRALIAAPWARLTASRVSRDVLTF